MKTGLCASIIFSLPPSLCISLQQTLGKQIDATFTEYSKTEFGASPSVQGSANCKLPCGSLLSSFHRWTASLLIFLAGPMGYLLSLRIGLLLLVALPEVFLFCFHLIVRASTLPLSSLSEIFQNLLASFPAISQKRKRCSRSFQHAPMFLLILDLPLLMGYQREIQLHQHCSKKKKSNYFGSQENISTDKDFFHTEEYCLLLSHYSLFLKRIFYLLPAKSSPTVSSQLLHSQRRMINRTSKYSNEYSIQPVHMC